LFLEALAQKRLPKQSKSYFRTQESHDLTGTIQRMNILVGTQLLAKGHDLPKLSLVAILLADNELQFPDFSSEERSYQLLHQLAGRVGRGHRAGTVLVQTYNPASPTIQAIQHESNDWQFFYETQLEHRRMFHFPPFYFALKLEVSRAKSDQAYQALEKIAHAITAASPNLKLVGPSPSFIAKKNGKWSWQLIVKAKQREQLIEIILHLPPRTTYDLDPVTLL
jgi:primosomal protein N' (replication factor Y) (superfamily II helicase)